MFTILLATILRKKKNSAPLTPGRPACVYDNGMEKKFKKPAIGQFGKRNEKNKPGSIIHRDAEKKKGESHGFERKPIRCCVYDNFYYKRNIITVAISTNYE